MRSRLVYIALFAMLTAAGCGNGDGGPEPPYPPGQYGTHTVGFRQFDLHDQARDRDVTTAVWYPAVAPEQGDEPVLYMYMIRGRAYADLAPDAAAAPFPLVMFSHGNQGVGIQSVTFTEHLASHGFVVAAPNHEGNTLLDSPDDEEMAQIALDRPVDVVFALEQLLGMNRDPTDDLHGLIDTASIGISGHSFGGYTALVLAGARVDVDAAAARCEAGIPGDIFCPCIPYWAGGTVVQRPAGAERFRAALGMAPGSWGAFGDEGLAAVDMPVMLMGGSLDEFTANDLRPIYEALPPPKYKLEIEKAGHMAFTDICRLGLLVPELEEMCDPATHLDIDRAFEIINTFATAFFRYHLLDEQGLADHLEPGSAEAFDEARLERE